MQNPEQSQESFKPVSREVSASLHSTRGESSLWSNSRANLSSGAATEVLVLSSCRRVSQFHERATSTIAHQIIIPCASSLVRSNVVISLNPIQSPSQLIVGAPFVAEISSSNESVETTLLSSSRGNAHLIKSSYLARRLSFATTLPSR